MKPVRCEMAGTVLEFKVKVGDTVRSGQEVCVVESMKMEVGVTSPLSGVVMAIHKKVGEFINEGDILLELQ